MNALSNLARQFDLMAKGCRSLGFDSQEDDWESRRQDANKGVVEPEVIVEAIDYDYRNGHDGRAAAELLVGALCADLRAATDRLARAYDHAQQIEAKVTCMCGDNIDHSAWSGHSPVSMFDHAVEPSTKG